jgi:hypothetical protein
LAAVASSVESNALYLAVVTHQINFMSQRLILLILLLCAEIALLVVLLRFYLSMFTPVA